MVNLTTEQYVKVTLKPLTALGRPARLDGVPGWASSDTNVVSLVIAPDGLSADVVSVGPGTAVVQVSADADLGPGVRELTATLDVTVIEAEAATMALEAGDVTNKAA